MANRSEVFRLSHRKRLLDVRRIALSPFKIRATEAIFVLVRVLSGEALTEKNRTSLASTEYSGKDARKNA